MTPKKIGKRPYRPNVGIMLANQQGDVFVGQRIDHTSHAWQMPQGGIDEGEDPRTAALRELEEETGVSPAHVSIEAESSDWLVYELPPELVTKLWGGRWRGQKQKWFLMRLNAPDDVINIATETPEFSSWRWLPADQLVESIVPFKRDVYRKILKEFGGLL